MTVHDVEGRIEALYGRPLPRDGGVVHVAAGWAAPDGALHNMRIVPQTPKSETDDFVLALARARADAIITTGRILREEAHPDPDSVGADDADLLTWRRDVMRREGAPLVVVLTRGEIDLSHLRLVAGRALVLTTHAAASALAAGAGAAGIGVIGRDRPGPTDTLAFLRDERGLGTVVIEAGPSVSSVLYQRAGWIDELMLSRFHGASLPDGVVGAPLPTDDVLRQAGLFEVSREPLDEASGLWSCSRFLRREDSL